MLAGHSTFGSNTATEQVQLMSGHIWAAHRSSASLLLKKNVIDAQRLVNLLVTDDSNTSKLLHEPCHRGTLSSTFSGKFFTQFATHPRQLAFLAAKSRPCSECFALHGIGSETRLQASKWSCCWFAHRHLALPRSPKTMDGAGTHAATQATSPCHLYVRPNEIYGDIFDCPPSK